MLEFNIRNQEISRIDNFSPAEKSVEYLVAKFNFKTEDWNEAIKRAIFRNVKSKVEKDAMLEDDSCVVPWEVLEGSGDIEVSVHGVIGTKDITTNVAVFNLNRTLQGGSATQEPSPTVYAQMVEMVKESKEVAQSVRTDADNGKFNGAKGDPGKDGKSAYQYAVEGGFKGTEQEFIDSMGKAGQVDLTGYVSKEQHEAELLKAFVKVTTDKASFHHITDSANMKVVDFGMEGITEQPTTSGKNFYSGGNISGTGYSWKKSISTIPAGTYMVSANVSSSDTDHTDRLILFYYEDNSSVGCQLYNGTRAKRKVTFSKNVNGIICYASNNSTNSADDTFSFTDIQIEPGEVATEYEPYTNGASPNSDYKQEIKKAGVYNEETGRYEHKCCVVNKNWYTGGNVSGVTNESNLRQNMKPIPAGNYIFSANVETTDTDSDKCFVIFYYEDGTSTASLIDRGIRKNTLVEFKKTVTYFRCFASNLNINAEGDTFSFTDIVIERGEVASAEYHPHASQPFTLTSPKPLTKWDNLVKVDGKWYWDYKQLKLVVDGSYWQVFSADKGFFRPNTLLDNSNIREGYCNQLRVGNSANNNTVALGYNNNYIYAGHVAFYDDTLEDKGLANWKAHLNEHPLEIVTYKDESELVPLLDEEQELLRNLEMYYGVTNIYNEQGCPISITYCADQELHWNQKLLQIQQAII